ncbi:MAG: hypothetical protein J4F28_01650 [Nitrosopumilaceae archaeon]|nr:hypothetical protein [Nitrosopumilaceae archaeon]
MAATKSLLGFVVIGVVSGLAFGAYLLDVRGGHPGSMPPVVEGPSISIAPAKSTFGPGETVTFSIMNTGTVPLHSEDGAYGATITGLSGITIYALTAQDAASGPIPAATAGAIPESEGAPFRGIVGTLMPGQKIVMSWDQTRQDGETAQPGLYKVNAYAYASDTGQVDSGPPGVPAHDTEQDTDYVRGEAATGDDMQQPADAAPVKDHATITIR